MKRRGFTLIELLAVIVILAIIALISVPIVMGVISSSKRGSFKNSISGIQRAAKVYQVKLYNEGNLDECVYFSFENDVMETTYITIKGEKRRYDPVSNLVIKGTLPTTGEIKICDESLYLEVSDGTHSGYIDEEGDLVVDTGKLEETLPTEVVIESINLYSTTNQIKATVDTSLSSEYARIKNYYYSLDGKNYTKTTSDNYTFTGLKSNTDRLYSICCCRTDIYSVI